MNLTTNSNNENTTIPHPKLPHVHCCIVQVHYRNPHFHDTFEINYVLNGAFRLSNSVQQFLCSKGDIILFNPNEVHELTAVGPSALILCIQISSSFCHDYFPNLDKTLFSDCCINRFFSEEERSIFLNRMLNASTAYWDASENCPYTCISNVVLMLGSLFSNVPCQQINANEYAAKIQTVETMKKIIEYIEENFSEDSLLQKLSVHIGYTTTYMSHFFKNHFHVSFQKYLMRYRLERAMQMLFSTNMPILDICNSCGFSDYRQLNSYCRSEFGHSAAASRKINFLNSKSHPSLTPSHPQAIQFLYSDQDCLDYFSNGGILQ